MGRRQYSSEQGREPLLVYHMIKYIENLSRYEGVTNFCVSSYLNKEGKKSKRVCTHLGKVRSNSSWSLYITEQKMEIILEFSQNTLKGATLADSISRISGADNLGTAISVLE